MNENAPETGPAVVVARSLADFQPLHPAEARVVARLGSGDFNRIDPAKPNGMLPLNYYYFLSMIGWALSLLAVAGFSGLVKSK
jgi:hypothetical protein